jgi:hypothetical protein
MPQLSVFSRNPCPLSTGIAVRFQQESVSAFDRNCCPHSAGIGVRFAQELVSGFSKNMQIAELNALNAALAIIKWKKLYGFYQDQSKEFNSVYSINDGVLINEDNFI